MKITNSRVWSPVPTSNTHNVGWLLGYDHVHACKSNQKGWLGFVFVLSHVQISCCRVGLALATGKRGQVVLVLELFRRGASKGWALHLTAAGPCDM